MTDSKCAECEKEYKKNYSNDTGLCAECQKEYDEMKEDKK